MTSIPIQANARIEIATQCTNLILLTISFYIHPPPFTHLPRCRRSYFVQDEHFPTFAQHKKILQKLDEIEKEKEDIKDYNK